MEDTGLKWSTKQEGLKTETLVTRTNEGASTWHPNTRWCHSSIVAIIVIIIIHSKYFPDSDWLKAHA